MADRYWVGGAGAWDSTNTTNWSTTSGGAGGASVPTSADTPIFDSNSGTGIVTFTNGGVTVGATTINNGSIELSLGAAFTTSGALTLTSGTFTTNNYNVTATSLSSSNSNPRTINLGSSTVTLSLGTATAFNAGISTNLTFNAGTSQITFTAGTTSGIASGGLTFNNVSFTLDGIVTVGITGANTFNNLTIAGRSSSGISSINIAGDQTITGTLTLSPGVNATARTFVRSNTIGETRTLTCAAVDSLQDIDFRDITIAGAAAPVSGTRLGDCKGNSGITFDAPKTVYYRATGSTSWGITSTSSWSLTEGGSATHDAFPIAQDTAVFPSATYPSSGSTVTINAAYNIGTIDMSARTSNAMTLSCSLATAIYGDWINGTGTTMTSIGAIVFAGRNTQTITSAGRTFTQSIAVNSPGGNVQLADAFVTNRSQVTAIQFTSGTFDAANYNITLTGAASGLVSNNSNIRSINIGSGTWTIAGTGGWDATTATNLTVTGTGTISLTNASAKSFIGGGIQTYPTLNQGGTGTLTVTGSNKFAGLTNTAIGRIQFTGGTTNEFTSFNVSGVSGNLLQIGSTNTTQATLIKPGAWNVGANSTDGGNNTGLSFTGSSPDYLSISYINGVATAAPTSSIYYGATNVTSLNFGGTPVVEMYYGATKVF
jgi:hypothetical protein